MDLNRDVQQMIRLSEPLAGGVPTWVMLPSGATVQAMVGIATEDDTLLHDSIICGQTRKLTFATMDVPSLKTQQNVTWNGSSWGILTTDFEANGAATVCFLGGGVLISRTDSRSE